MGCHSSGSDGSRLNPQTGTVIDKLERASHEGKGHVPDSSFQISRRSEGC